MAAFTRLHYHVQFVAEMTRHYSPLHPQIRRAATADLAKFGAAYEHALQVEPAERAQFQEAGMVVIGHGPGCRRGLGLQVYAAPWLLPRIDFRGVSCSSGVAVRVSQFGSRRMCLFVPGMARVACPQAVLKCNAAWDAPQGPLSDRSSQVEEATQQTRHRHLPTRAPLPPLMPNPPRVNFARSVLLFGLSTALADSQCRLPPTFAARVLSSTGQARAGVNSGSSHDALIRQVLIVCHICRCWPTTVAFQHTATTLTLQPAGLFDQSQTYHPAFASTAPYQRQPATACQHPLAASRQVHMSPDPNWLNTITCKLELYWHRFDSLASTDVTSSALMIPWSDMLPHAESHSVITTRCRYCNCRGLFLAAMSLSSASSKRQQQQCLCRLATSCYTKVPTSVLQRVVTAEHHSQRPPRHQTPHTVRLEGQGTQSGHTVGPTTASSLLGTHAFLKLPLEPAEPETRQQARRRATSDKDAACFTVLLCYWPQPLAELRTRLEQPCYDHIPAPALCHTLTHKYIRAVTWQGFGILFTTGPTLLTFWHQVAAHPCTLPRPSQTAPCVHRPLHAGHGQTGVGNKACMIKSCITDVPGVPDPCNPGDTLTVVIACQADGSKVRIQQDRDHSAFAHLTRTVPHTHDTMAARLLGETPTSSRVPLVPSIRA